MEQPNEIMVKTKEFLQRYGILSEAHPNDSDKVSEILKSFYESKNENVNGNI
jgi:uroporphyrinogen-III synthase